MSATYHLQLFVANRPDRVKLILAAIEVALKVHIKAAYEIEVIDVVADPARAVAERVIMTPTLVVKVPPPERRLIGDLGDVDKLCIILDLGQGETGVP